MQFLRWDCADASGFAEALTAYRAYLRTIKNRLPPETYAYAAAEWHYDDGRRGPHDASSGGHGDWLIDEVRLSEEGLVIHEIEFSNGCSWVITYRNLVHRDQRRG